MFRGCDRLQTQAQEPAPIATTPWTTCLAPWSSHIPTACGAESCQCIHVQHCFAPNVCLQDLLPSSSIYSDNTISPLLVTSTLMSKILQKHHVHPNFIQVLLSFGEVPHGAEAGTSYSSMEVSSESPAAYRESKCPSTLCMPSSAGWILQILSKWAV